MKDEVKSYDSCQCPVGPLCQHTIYEDMQIYVLQPYLAPY